MSCEPRSGSVVASMSALHSLVHSRVHGSAAQQPFAGSQLFWVPEEACVSFSDRQGSKTILPLRTESKEVSLPWSLSTRVSGWALCFQDPLRPTPKFSFQQTNLILSKNAVVLLPFVSLKHISIFISFIYFLFYRRFYIRCIFPSRLDKDSTGWE